jgi:lipopolysaccharide export system permease protein
VKPGVFQKLDENTVLRADRVSRGGDLLLGFFSDSLDPGSQTRTTIAAKQAEIRRDEDGKPVTLFLTGAEIVKEKAGEKPSLLTAGSYPWDIPMLREAAYGPRGQDEREMTLGELARGGVKGVDSEGEPSKLVAERHLRLVQSASLPFLVMLAVPLAFIGRGRSGQAAGIVLGVVVLVLYEKMLGIGEAFVGKGDIAPALGLWGPFALLVMTASVTLLRAVRRG